MSKILIAPFSKKEGIDMKTISEPFLEVSEFFYDTIQGEGTYTGYPAVFLRVTNCTLHCKWCDTKEVWRWGNQYTFDELFTIMDNDGGVVPALHNGAILVVTGGSPLLQDAALCKFFAAFEERYFFTPVIHVENECVLMPSEEMVRWVDVWINSPKLDNSHMIPALAYKPEVLSRMNKLPKSWFKFVIDNHSDWKEILERFIEPGIIDEDKVILMPQGITRDEILENGKKVAAMATKNGVLFSTRLHVLLWNLTVSV